MSIVAMHVANLATGIRLKEYDLMLLWYRVPGHCIICGHSPACGSLLWVTAAARCWLVMHGSGTYFECSLAEWVCSTSASFSGADTIWFGAGIHAKHGFSGVIFRVADGAQARQSLPLLLTGARASNN